MRNLCFKRTPIIFTSRETVTDTLLSVMPYIGEPNTFKLCNFCGPYTTHADGCREAIKMFEATYLEYEHMEKLEERCQKTMLMAAFKHKYDKSIVVFVSTTCPSRTEWFRKLYEHWVKLCTE